MRELTAHERKTYDRLRKAYRRAGMTVVRRKGTIKEVEAACRRVTAHALCLGWLRLVEKSRDPLAKGEHRSEFLMTPVRTAP